MTQTVQTTNGIMALDAVVEKYIFCKPLQGEEAKEVYDEVRRRVKTDFRDVPAFNVHFGYNGETGEINGSTIGYGILVNQTLEEKGLWLPTIVQAKKIDAQEGFSNGVYRDFGAVVYSEGEPNKKVAERMIKEAKARGWKLPILASIRNLSLEKGDDLLGVNITIANDEGIMTGDEARQYLENNFDYQGNSGACRVIRVRNGSWIALWDRFDDSYDSGRVDWMCGEATAKNLEAAVSTDINKIAQEKVEEVNKRISNARQTAIQILNR